MGWHANELFCFNDTATTEIYTLSLRDAVPISDLLLLGAEDGEQHCADIRRTIAEHVRDGRLPESRLREDRKSTRLNSSHANISYAVFCLKKKTTNDYSSFPPLLAPSQPLLPLR